MTSIPFQKSAVQDKRPERRCFSPPDMGRVPFQNAKLDTHHFSNYAEECNELAEELMAESGYLDNLDQSEEIEVWADCEDDIEGDSLQTLASESLPVAQQEPAT